MPSALNQVARWLVFAVVVFLTACGGGGGGGADDSGALPGGSGLAVSGGSNPFVLDQGGLLSSQSYDVTWSASTVTHIAAGMPAGRTQPSWLSLALTGSSSPMRLHVGLTDTSVALGTYATTVRVAAYAGPTMLDVVDIPVSIEVVERPTVSPTALTFNMVEGTLPAMQSITLTRSIGAVNIGGVQVIGLASWLSASPAWQGANVSIGSTALSLAVGSYASTVAINYNGGQASIPVRLNISSALNVPAGITFNIDQNSGPTDKTQTITIGSHRTDTLSWTAEVDQTWLSISPTTGDTTSPDNLVVSLSQAALDTFDNGTYTATITVSSTSPNVSAARIPVTLNYTRPQVNYVSPYEAVAGVQAEVVIRGTGFEGITNPSISFNATPAVSFTVVSDTEVRATHPALAQGDYPVQLSGDSGPLVSHATLIVRDPVNYDYASIPDIGAKRAIFYNTERRAIYVLYQDNGALRRYAFNGTNWAPPLGPSPSDAGLQYGGVALSPDGKGIYAIADPYVLKIDPDTLAKTVLNGGPGVPAVFHRAAFANDGRLLFTYQWNSSARISRYDIDFNALDVLYNGNYADSAQRLAAASLDGSRIFFVSRTNNAGIRYYDASTGTLTSTTVWKQANSISVDRTAARLVIGTDIYDGSLTLLGSLPVATAASVIAPDGDFAYTFEATGTTGMIRKFDLNSPNGGGFTEVGAGTSVANSPGASPVMAISPDEATLFIAGDQNIIVQPSP